eukprot:6473061-Prymnesium_polylepis.1
MHSVTIFSLLSRRSSVAWSNPARGSSRLVRRPSASDGTAPSFSSASSAALRICSHSTRSSAHCARRYSSTAPSTSVRCSATTLSSLEMRMAQPSRQSVLVAMAP